MAMCKRHFPEQALATLKEGEAGGVVFEICLKNTVRE
jgi:hypothetical protein